MSDRLDAIHSFSTLEERWDEASSACANHAMRSGLLDFAPFGYTTYGSESYLDYRGLRISGSVKSVQLSRIDLSFSSTILAGQFVWAKLNDCIFIETKKQTNLGHEFFRCNFTKGNLTGVVFRGDYEECTFDQGSLRNAIGSPRFVRCSFNETNFTGAHLIDATFEHCSWEQPRFGNGSLHRARFIGTWPDDDSLKNTIVTRVERVS